MFVTLIEIVQVAKVQQKLLETRDIEKSLVQLKERQKENEKPRSKQDRGMDFDF